MNIKISLWSDSCFIRSLKLSVRLWSTLDSIALLSLKCNYRPLKLPELLWNQLIYLGFLPRWRLAHFVWKKYELVIRPLNLHSYYRNNIQIFQPDRSFIHPRSKIVNSLSTNSEYCGWGIKNKSRKSTRKCVPANHFRANGIFLNSCPTVELVLWLLTT